MNSSIQNILLVAGREIGTRAREKSFVISTGLLMAVIIIGAVVWSSLSGGESVDRVGVVGGDRSLAQTIEATGAAAGQRISAVAVPDASAA
ncbi:MAG: ABC transporter permease, partial [Gordonia sp. (in: high G+C Gram-positive bacteria)]